MTTEGLPPTEREASSLDDPSTGARIIRGSAYRTVGFGIVLLLGLVSTLLLTRHLGVEDFGRYVTVLTLMMIVTLVADAGLTVVGVREYVNRSHSRRRALMGNLLGVRIVVAIAASAAIVGVVAAAGAEPVIVAGSAVAGAGVVVAMVQQTFVTPLHAEVRLAFATALEVLRQVLTVAGIVVLIAAGAGLVPFLALGVPAGILVALITVAALRRTIVLRPRLDRDEVRYLLRESIPAAAAGTLLTLFYRVGVLMVSVLATATATGYFATSFRVVEAFVAIPPILTGAALPALARFVETDRPRLASALHQLFDVCVLLGAISTVAVVFMAQPAIDVIGGDEFQPAVDVLRIQAVALGATFLVALFGGALWILRENRALVTGNVLGVAAALVLCAILVPIDGANGAAAGMVAAEAILGCYLGAALLRRHPDLRPSLSRLPRVLLATVAALAIWFVPLADVPRAALALALMLVLLRLLGALPRELWTAFRPQAASR